MGFVQREVERLSARILEELNAPAKSARFDELYAARQALAWALEPDGVQSPYKMITGEAGESLLPAPPHGALLTESVKPKPPTTPYPHPEFIREDTLAS